MKFNLNTKKSSYRDQQRKLKLRQNKCFCCKFVPQCNRDVMRPTQISNGEYLPYALIIFTGNDFPFLDLKTKTEGINSNAMNAVCISLYNNVHAII